VRWRSFERSANVNLEIAAANPVSSLKLPPGQIGGCGDSTKYPWYAAYVCTHHEQKIVGQFRERGLSCFLPTYRSVRRWKDRRKELEMVLFPGYVFVQIDLCNRLRVLEIPGVVCLVTSNGKPVPVPEGEIESLRSGLASGMRAEPHPFLTAGRHVRVKYGPLQGLEGVLLRRKEGFRLVLSLELIQRSVAVEIDEGDVEAR
jgi:transcription termination/antitermination protein NusG